MLLALSISLDTITFPNWFSIISLYLESKLIRLEKIPTYPLVLLKSLITSLSIPLDLITFKGKNVALPKLFSFK